ncbi:YihY family inner membrane protein [Pseudoxanthomonas sp. JBR18]|uniref:YihY family inner membrane protein n=1 Tax=Pseudoxanthomonas sp. JBR18 TaxID=2969308 RepID=UPI002305ADF3|nr:YihY family inner membrane protein [Pseudoxanthomonas sp. JBR18]WCE02845.1 YihY family inner membrane protein [Pseudoxanthomonas sp. JBR18]
MSVSHTLQRWNENVRDRARVAAFSQFLLKRFWDDRLFQTAAALAYTTMFALVPLAMVVFGVLSAFPGFAQWSDTLSDYIFSNFVPSAARAAEGYLRQFSEAARDLTVAGVIALVVSLLITLNSVEAAFNRIWRVSGSRPRLGRFVMYWTVLTLGALLSAASLAITARVFALPLFKTEQGRQIASIALALAPVMIELCAIAVIYRVVPHRSIHWRYAFAGALLATIGLELIKWGMGLYLSSFGSYTRVYGVAAVAPILMLWIYLSWGSILLGASLAASMSAFRYQPESMRLPQGFEIYGLLRLLGRFHEARAEGRGLSDDKILQLEPMLTDSLVQEFLEQLSRIKLLRCTEDGEWLLARDLESTSLAELYEACQLRVPIAEAHLPCQDDALGQAAREALDRIRLPVRDLLRHRAGALYPPVSEPRS